MFEMFRAICLCLKYLAVIFSKPSQREEFVLDPCFTVENGKFWRLQHLLEDNGIVFMKTVQYNTGPNLAKISL